MDLDGLALVTECTHELEKSVIDEVFDVNVKAVFVLAAEKAA